MGKSEKDILNYIRGISVMILFAGIGLGLLFGTVILQGASNMHIFGSLVFIFSFIVLYILLYRFKKQNIR